MELKKIDLIRMIKGHEKGSYQLAEYLNKRGLGELTGFPNEHWYWNTAALEKMGEEALINLYETLNKWVDPPIPKPQLLSREEIQKLQQNYFDRYGVWLPVDDKFIEPVNNKK